MGIEEAAARTRADAGARRHERTLRTRSLTVSALIVAFIAASAWITLPIGAVPVTLQVFVVLLAGLLLSPAWAAASMAAYLLLGLAGAPVFSGGGAGIGYALGPTGGYLLGFVFAALVVALTRRPIGRLAGAPIVGDMLAVLLGVGTVYLSGWSWLMYSLGLTPLEAAVAGVGPFIFPDVLKGVSACLVAAALRRGGVVPVAEEG